MALIRHLNHEQLEAVVAITDIKPLLNAMYAVLQSVPVPNDEVLEKRDAAFTKLANIEVLLDAAWGTGRVVANAILHP